MATVTAAALSPYTFSTAPTKPDRPTLTPTGGGLSISFKRRPRPLAASVTFPIPDRSRTPTGSPSFKVAILGAAGGIGQSLALLAKMSPLVSDLRLYDLSNAEGVAADLSHCNTPSLVRAFTGVSDLPAALAGSDVVVVPAGVPRRPGMTRDDLFSANAGVVRSLVESVADNCPSALLHIITNPVNSTVPLAAEVLRRRGVYDPRRLFGVTTLDVVRASAFVARAKGLQMFRTNVPVVGGHAGVTILPLFSKTAPSVLLGEGEARELTERVRAAGTQVVEAKAGAGSATLSMAYAAAAARFLESALRGLDGDTEVYECSYVQSDLVPGLPFFASTVKMGMEGVEVVVRSDLERLSGFEAEEFEKLKPELRTSIEKGVNFALRPSS